MAEEDNNSRLETFCDGVFAIALTLLILEIKTPVANSIHHSEDLWQSLKYLLPAVYAFLLSFAIIVISWVNHHSMLKGINKSTPHFIYANIFLLLTIVIIPFPTALFAEFGFTEAASPAVVLYGFVMLLTNVGWILITRTALKPKLLARNEKSKAMVENIYNKARSAFVLYLLCTILAFWFPLVISIILTLTWIAWLILGLNFKEK
jgi:uncharacterized membrane protein